MTDKALEQEEMPDFEVGDKLELTKLVATEHSTQPPARFTEATLAAKLDELSIGRPSTLASIITVNQTRGYVKKKGQQLFPTWTGMKVAQYLEGKVSSFVAYEATAQMEDELDQIENGALKKDAFLDREWKKIQKDVLGLQANIDWDEVDELGTIDLHNGFAVKVNSFGAWLEDTSVPPDKDGRRRGVKLSDGDNVAEFDFSDPEVCREIYNAGQNKEGPRELGVLSSGAHEGWTIIARDGRYGAYLQALPPQTVKAYAEGKKAPAGAPKAVNQPLPEGMELSTITLEEASALFEEVKLPRWSPDGKWLVGVGKRGPYMGRKATPKGRPKFRSLPEGTDPRTVSFEEVVKFWEASEEEEPAGKKPVKKTAKKAVKKTPSKKK